MSLNDSFSGYFIAPVPKARVVWVAGRIKTPRLHKSLEPPTQS